MCNYGAGFNALRANPACKDLTDEQIQKLYEAYGKTFPKVKDYQMAVQRTINRVGFVENEFGRRYYIKNTRFAYKCANYLIQGKTHNCPNLSNTITQWCAEMC